MHEPEDGRRDLPRRAQRHHRDRRARRGRLRASRPVTNPTSTTIFKALIALKTRNPIVFAFHPAAQQCSVDGGPGGARRGGRGRGARALHPVDRASLDRGDRTLLMNHPGVALILATGGNAMVRAAYSCGKPALGVGRGQRPRLHRAHREAPARRQRHRAVQGVRQRHGLRLRAGRHPRRADLRRRHGRVRAGCTPTGRPPPRRQLLEEFLFGVAAGGAQLRRGEAQRRRRRPDPGVDRRAGRLHGARRHVDHPRRGRRRRAARAADPGEARARCWPCCARSDADAGHRAGRRRWWSSTGSATAPPSTREDDALVVEEFGRRVKAVRIIANAPDLARRHRRHLQRVHPVAHPRLRLVRPQLGVRTTSPR